MPIGSGSFESFGVPGANQGMSVLIHVARDYAIRENSSSLDPNNWKIQLSFLKLFSQRFSPILRQIKLRRNFRYLTFPGFKSWSEPRDSTASFLRQKTKSSKIKRHTIHYERNFSYNEIIGSMNNIRST